MRIVIVDDEYWCVTELKEILSKIRPDWMISTYQNPRTAMNMILEDPPDLVFIDAQMPGLSGIELSKVLKDSTVGVKIVLMSEKSSYACEGFDIGVDDFILKPLKIERIRNSLSRLFQTT